MMLNDENVPVPSVYNKENKAYGKETTYTIAPVILWDSSRVWKILTAYVYTGAMVLGKTKTLISGKSIIRTVPKGQRYITEGTHEAIVSREEFEKAQLVIKSNSHKVLMGSVDFPLKGKVRCGNCRRVMAHNFKQAVPTFWCREGLELVGQTQCTSEVFQVSDIENAVFQALKKELSLLDEYNIFVKTQRGRYSYLLPERNKFISERSLGDSCKRECLEGFFVQNAEKNLRYKEDPILIFTTRTRLRLVVDLQENVKAQENLAYALKVKISNLQKMAETLVWVQENNINDLTELNDLCKTAQANAQAAYERLSQAEDELYKTNEQIHYAGQYLSTKEVQQQFTKAIFKKKFRAEHSKELDAYVESVKYFREENDGKLPSLKFLKKRKEELTKEIAERKKVYTPLKEESRRLEVASDNVYSIFRKTNEMKSDLAWKREWEARVREKARQEQVRQEQRVRQPKRKKRSYDVSL